MAAPVRPTEQPEGQLTSLRLDPTLNTRTDLRNEELATIEMFQRVSASVVFVTSITLVILAQIIYMRKSTRKTLTGF